MVGFHDHVVTRSGGFTEPSPLGFFGEAGIRRRTVLPRPVAHGMTGPQQIDLAQLPDELSALVDALAPGEQLLLVRDGTPVATVTARPAPPPPDEDADLTVVATAMKLSPSARQSLSAELGPDYLVLDLHSAPATADVVLVPPVSPQLIGGLRDQFPKARVVIAEVEDAELGISYEGPVRRLLDAGAETYLTTSTLPHLARQLDYTVTRPQLTGGSAPRRELSPAPQPPASLLAPPTEPSP